VASHARFAPLFGRSKQRAWAAGELRGLLTADVPRKHPHAGTRQQCIGEGGPEDAAILDAHRRLVDETLGEADGVLMVDESAIPKCGGHSDGEGPPDNQVVRSSGVHPFHQTSACTRLPAR
jgi:hypothetical protein